MGLHATIRLFRVSQRAQRLSDVIEPFCRHYSSNSGRIFLVHVPRMMKGEKRRKVATKDCKGARRKLKVQSYSHDKRNDVDVVTTAAAVAAARKRWSRVLEASNYRGVLPLDRSCRAKLWGRPARRLKYFKLVRLRIKSLPDRRTGDEIQHSTQHNLVLDQHCQNNGSSTYTPTIDHGSRSPPRYQFCHHAGGMELYRIDESAGEDSAVRVL